MIYGKMNIELRYFLHLRFVLVTRKAKSPPKSIAVKHEKNATTTVFRSGVQRFVFASSPVKS